MKKTFLFAMCLFGLTAATASAQEPGALHQQACDEGDAYACNVLALMYEVGQDVERDVERAAELYGRACEGGELTGCASLGAMYQVGVGVPADIQMTVSYYERACYGGEMSGCDGLAGLYETGSGVLQSPTRAAQFYEMACDGGLVASCNRLGALVQAGQGVPANQVAALELYQRACQGGDQSGCVNLGVSYERGEGVAQDPVRAAEFYQGACDADEPRGCVNLGSLYRTGTGVDQDLRFAATLYRRACDQGEPLGCFNLGASYERGEGVPQDVVTAITFYQRSCEGGAAIGCARLPQAVQPVEVDYDDQTTFDMVGRVTDEETDEQLADAIIDIPGLGIRAVTDAGGRVQLSDLPRGWHPIRVEASGYEVVDGDLQVPGSTEEFAVELPRALVADADASGRVIGRVVGDGAFDGLSDVDIELLGTDKRAISNPQGRFTFTDVEPGLAEFRFSRLGYASRVSQVVIHPGKTIEVQARMSTEPIELEPIQVVAVRSEYLERVGYYERGETTYGHQFDWEELDALNLDRLSDVTYYTPGVTMIGGDIDSPSVIVSRRRAGGDASDCRLEIYLDGVRQFGDRLFNIDNIPRTDVEAIEFYQGINVPSQYQRQSSGFCGVVLVWTRRGA